MTYKQAIVLRRDLKMGTGKAIAQACHASLGAYKLTSPRVRKLWEESGAKKVILRVNSESELLEIYKKAKEKKLPCFLVVDAGLTQLKPGTKTAVAIGPCKEKQVDEIVGHLKLY